MRPLDSVISQAVAGTEEGALPFWAPDSRSIGFFARGKLNRIEATGGPVLSLADAPDRCGGT